MLENEFQNFSYRLSLILFRSQCVKCRHFTYHPSLVLTRDIETCISFKVIAILIWIIL